VGIKYNREANELDFDFDEKEIDKAIESYNQRERRFGGVKNV